MSVLVTTCMYYKGLHTIRSTKTLIRIDQTIFSFDQYDVLLWSVCVSRIRMNHLDYGFCKR